MSGPSDRSPSAAARHPHHWLIAPDESAADASVADTLAEPGVPPVLAVLDAHRRLRGPFTAAGALMRQLVPGVLAADPAPAIRHDIEILSAAPELSPVLPCRRETLTSLTAPQKRTRYYPYIRTTRIAHGLIDFLTAVLDAPATLVVRHAEHADPTDADWLALLLRRADPQRLRIVVCTAGRDVPQPLAAALAAHTTPREVPATPLGPLPADPAARWELAAAWVAADRSTDDPAAAACYAELGPAERARLHEARAEELAAAARAGETSLLRGPLAHHRVLGTDPAGAGALALQDALQECLLEGFYDALVELGPLTHAVLDWATRPEECWLVTARMTIAYSVMGGRADEALALYDDACASTALPAVHMSAAYGRAMVYTRYLEPERRDHRKAKGWVNTAVALSRLADTDARRAYNRTFNENGLALIEMHLGDPARALELVEAGIERMDGALDAEDQGQHRSVLEYNRAQLLARLVGPEAGAAAYDRVIAQDPHHSEYYFERAVLLRKLGRDEEALEDYEHAIRTSPPYPEAVYNRADLRLELGDLEAALADFDRVLELDPEFLDAYVNRAGLRYSLGDVRGAADDVAEGLAREAGQPHLLALRGLLAQDHDRPEDARADLEAALAGDPDLPAAWAALGVLAYERDEAEESVRCFDRSLQLEDDPVVRANRALAHESCGNWTAAAADYAAAIDLLLPEAAAVQDGEDPAEMLAELSRLRGRRAECTARSTS